MARSRGRGRGLGMGIFAAGGDTERPGLPTSLVATAGEESITLTWTDPDDEDLASIRVYRSITSGAGFSLLATVDAGEEEYEDDTILPNITYFYYLRSRDTNNNMSAATAEVSEIVVVEEPDTEAPAAPTGFTAVAEIGKVVLEWIDPTAEDLDGINIYRSLTTETGFTLLDTVAAGVEIYEDEDVEEEVTYFYHLTAFDDSENESDPSAEASDTVPVNPDTTAPAAPTELDATADGLSVVLTWTDPDDEDLDEINIYRSLTTTTGFTLLDTVDAGEEEYLDEAVEERVTYFYRVTAVDAASNESDPSDEASDEVPDITAPDAPTSLSAAAGEESITLEWTDPEDEDLNAVNIYRSLTTGTGFSWIASVSPGVEEYEDEDIEFDTEYFYHVTAEDDFANESEPSNEDSAEVEAPELTGVTVVPTSWQVTNYSNENRNTHEITHNFVSESQDGSLYVLVGVFLDGTSNLGSVPGDVTVVNGPPTGGGTQIQNHWFIYKPDAEDLLDGSKLFSFGKNDEMGQLVSFEVIGADASDPIGDLANNRSSNTARTDIASVELETDRPNCVLITSCATDGAAGDVSIDVNSANGFSTGIDFDNNAANMCAFLVNYREVENEDTYNTPSYTASGTGGTQLEAFVIQPPAA